MYGVGKCKDWLRLEASPEEATLCQKNVQWLRQNLFGEGANIPAATEALETSQHPLRLIDVNPAASYDCRLVVVNANMVSPCSPYLALSYCWGDSGDAGTQFKTENATIDGMMRGFLLEEVPKCIRDAVEVSRALGVQYLWVDALCILQDDKSDWEMQSSQMARIYGNAVAVICAAASSSCNQGFLERDKTSASIKFQSKIDSTIFGDFNIRFYDKIQQNYQGQNSTTRMDTLRRKWSTRGWTYQEFYLAQRAIIFGVNKIHYRSSNNVWTENEKSTRDAYITAPDKNSIQEKDDFVISGWIDAVFYFANRNFSIVLDKLPAISGFTQTVLGSSPDNYLAGIRKSHLHRDLLWALVAGEGGLVAVNDRTWAISSLRSPDPYIAPSWSWASRETAIQASEYTGHLMFGPLTVQDFRKEYSKVETHVLVIGRNPYGHVSHGSLTFSAIVVPLWARLEKDKLLWAKFLAKRTFRHHSGDDFSARVLLDWVPSERDEPIEGLWFFLLGSCCQKDDSSEPQDWPSSGESEDGSNDTNRSEIKGSNDESSEAWSNIQGEGETIEQTTSPAIDDADYDSRFSGTERAEIGNGVDLLPTRQENYRDEASSETQSEPDRKISTFDLSTALSSSHESGECANHSEPDDLLESESGSESDYSGDVSDEGRIAYGLIILPTGEPGQFFRVGIWASHDIDFFQGRQESTFELI